MIESPFHLIEEESYNLPDLFHHWFIGRIRAVLLLDGAQVRRVEKTVSVEVHQLTLHPGHWIEIP